MSGTLWNPDDITEFHSLLMTFCQHLKTWLFRTSLSKLAVTVLSFEVLHCVSKNILKNYQILIIFGSSILHTTCHQMIAYFPPHPMSASALPRERESQPSELCIEVYVKHQKYLLTLLIVT